MRYRFYASFQVKEASWGRSRASQYCAEGLILAAGQFVQLVLGAVVENGSAVIRSALYEAFIDEGEELHVEIQAPSC